MFFLLMFPIISKTWFLSALIYIPQSSLHSVRRSRSVQFSCGDLFTSGRLCDRGAVCVKC